VNLSRGVVRVRVAAAVVVGLTLALAGCTATSPPDVLAVTDPGDGRSAAIGGDAGNGGVKLRNFLVVSDGNGKPGTLVGAISNETGGAVQVTLTVVQTDANGQQAPVGSTSVSLKPSEFVQFGGSTGSTSGTTSPSGSAATSSPSGSAATPSPSASSARSIGASGTYTPTPPPSSGNPTSIGNEPATGRVINYQIPAVQAPAGAFLQLFARAPAGGATIDIPILPPVGPYANLSPQAASSAGSSATSSPSPTGSPSGSVSPSVQPSGAATQTREGSPSPSSS
jgi:hypothetical protein